MFVLVIGDAGFIGYHVSQNLIKDQIIPIIIYNLEEWGRRNKERGTEWLWKDNKDSWDSLLKLFASDKSAIKHIVLKPNEYLSDKLSDILQ